MSNGDMKFFQVQSVTTIPKLRDTMSERKEDTLGHHAADCSFAEAYYLASSNNKKRHGQPQKEKSRTSPDKYFSDESTLIETVPDEISYETNGYTRNARKLILNYHTKVYHK